MNGTTDKYIQQDQKDSALNPKFGRQSIDRHDDHNFRYTHSQDQARLDRLVAKECVS